MPVQPVLGGAAELVALLQVTGSNQSRRGAVGSSLPACSGAHTCCHKLLTAQNQQAPQCPLHTLPMGPRRASLGPSLSKGTAASPCTPDPEEEPQRDYLGLVVKFIPVPRVLAAHGGVIQEQHGHLSKVGKASLTPGQFISTLVLAGTKTCHAVTLASASSSPSRSFCAETRFSAANLCLQCSAT